MRSTLTVHPLLIALLLAALAGCPQKEPAPTPEKARGAAGPAAAAAPDPGARVVARVNDAPITADELGFKLLGGHGQRITPDIQRKSLDRLIDAELIYQYGKRLGLDRDAKYRHMVRRLELQLKAVQRKEMHRIVFNREVAAKVKITEDAARAYFKAHADKIKRSYRLAMLQFDDVEQAQAFQKQLAAGQAFEALARARHPPKEGARPAWELGWMQWRQLPMEWVGPVGALKPGQVSEVVKGLRTGVRIFKLLELKPEPEVTYEALKNALMNRLRDKAISERHEAVVAELRAKAKIVKK